MSHNNKVTHKAASTSWKIYIAISKPIFSDIQIKRLEALGELTIIEADKKDSEKTLEKLRDADIILAGSSGFEYFSKEFINNIPNLKLISIFGVGTAWLDTQYARSKNISIANTKGSNSQSVAEHTWGMIFNITKKITEADRKIRNEGEYKFSPFEGKESYGKTLGVIGVGDIGSKVAKIGLAFDMKVIGVDRRELVTGVDMVDLDFLLKESDIISICAPLTEETRGMISYKEFEKMKDGVVVVNCAREDIVDKNSLFGNLKSGKVFGYGVDAEIMKEIDQRYLEFDNVVVTPHTAFFTTESEERTLNLAIENVEKFLEGKPQNIVN